MRKKGFMMAAAFLFLASLTGCGSQAKTREAMQLIEELDYQGALTLFGQAREQKENERLIARGEGIAYMGLAEYEQAITCFMQALADSDGVPESMDYDLNYYLAAAYAKAGDYAAAEKTYNAILALRPKEKNACFLRGSVRLGLGNYTEAKEDFDKVISMEPNNYDRLISIYEVLNHYGYQEVGQAYLQTALETGEKQMNTYDRGRFYYYMGDYQKAYIALEEAKTKGGAESYLYLGKAYEATGDYNYAASVYNNYLGKEGGNAQVFNQLGLCEMKRRDYRKALEAFQAGLNQEGENDRKQALSFNEAIAYEYLGEYKEANAKLKAYLKNYPDDAEAIREQQFLSTR
ncbi:MAG: tetratricopeptide repeat protein [Roseburia sp.]|nr:tetratricopeptide repeat protein [Roseburia sp.]